MGDEDDEAQTCKVVLLGESGVGKTCIIARFINNTFEENLISTTGASYAGKTMTFDEYDGKSIRFEIWDTAGQEKYRSLTKIFYKDAGAAILVYDITRKESYEEIQKYWFNQIKDHAPKNIIVAMAANKSDLIEKEQVNEAEARKYAKEVGALFKVTSACTAAGIEELFRSIGCKILNPNYTDEDEGKPVKPTQQPQPTKNDKKDPKIKLGDKKAEKKKEKKGFC